MGPANESRSNAAVTAGSSSSNNQHTTTPTTSPFKTNLAPGCLALTPLASGSTPSPASTSAFSSTHPSPHGAMDAMTPRSLQHHDSSYSNATDTRGGETIESPFFANWDSSHHSHASSSVSDKSKQRRSVQADSQDGQSHPQVRHEEDHTCDVFGMTVTDDPDKRYSLASTSATTLSTPLFTSATRSSLFPAPSPASSNSNSLTPSLRPTLQVSTTTPSTPQGWPAPSTPLSPLPATALAPSAPKLGTLPTPIMSPRNSLPNTPALYPYHRTLSPLQARADLADAVSETSSNILSLLDVQGKLPLPGQLEDEDVTISSAMLNSTMRSESVDSISSVLNDLGHDSTTPPNENREEQEEEAHMPSYTGSAFIQDINAPPLQPLPMQSQVIERALPMPPAKHPSDPPLISSLRRPDFMHLAGEASSSSHRPISPFSPSLVLFPEDARRPSMSSGLDRQIRSSTPDPDQDLINFDSDEDDQFARYRDNEGDATYLNHGSYRPDYSQQYDADSLSLSSNEEEEEEEDYSSHALYATLSISDSPYVRRAWEGSKVVLIPASHTLPQAFLASSKQYNANTSLDNPEEWERFTGVHALRQDPTSPNTYAGYGETADGFRLHARLDSENKQIQISLRQELDSSSSLNGPAYNEFGMATYPASQPLFRHTASSSTASTQSGAIPPHLLISSPATSVESSNFPTTPPLSQEMSPTLPSSSNMSSGSGSTPRIPQAIAFPSIEQAQKNQQQFTKSPLSPTRRLNIVHEKFIYRKRRVKSTVSTSAPSTMPSPPAMSRDGSSQSQSSATAAAQVNSIQQATDRLSKLSTPSMQSIASIASVSTNNGKSVKKKDSKVRLRVPKWLGGRNRDSVSGPLAGLKVTESAPSTPIVPLGTTQPAIQEEVQLVIEKVRVIQVDSYIVEWPGEEAIVSPRDFRKSLPLSARQSQQNFAARMHRKSSQPLTYTSSSHQMQDATVRQRKSFQYPSFSTTFVEDANEDGPTVSSAAMTSRHNSNASRSSRVSKRSSSGLRMKHSSQTSSSQGMTRDFSSDIAYLLEPPKYLEHFSGLFEQCLKLIIRSSKDFAERFYYIRGQEQEAVTKLKTEVLGEVWQYFADEDSIHGLRHHLLDIFENATMAFAHDYVYAKTIKPSYAHTEMDFGNLINLYRVHTISMADFGISSGHYSEATFAPVVDILSELCGSGASRQELWEKMPPQSYKRLVQLISQTTDSASTVIALLEAKTPLDTIAQLRKVIDELVKATSSSDSGHDESHSRLATDDLIPLLSWALVKANAKTLPSLLFYSKMFRLSAHTQADSEWTIVQFEAAMAFLSTDPLRLQKGMTSASPAIESHSVSPVQPLFLRTVSEDSLGLPGRSRRSSIQSLPPDSARGASRSPSQQTHLASYHKRTLSSLPSTRMALYQAAGRPSSIVSAVTTEEDEDNAEMGPPAPPRKDSLGGSADGHDLLSASTMSSGRERSTSPPIHRPVAVRPPRRPFHLSHDQMSGMASQSTRIPLGRSQTTPLNPGGRPLSLSGNRASMELHRAGSDASRRGSVDWWGPLRYAVAGAPTSPPVGSEGTMSSRPDSPASPAVKSIDRHGSARSSFDLERSTSDIGWVEWGRRRLSSMTSSIDSAESGRSVADQIAEKIAASAARGVAVPTANRGRRKSESAATALSPVQFEDAAAEIQAIAAPASNKMPTTSSNIGARSLTSAGSRPRSTLSLSSTSSLDTDASLGRSTNTASVSVAGRSQFRNSIAGPPSSYSSHSSNLSRSRRFRKELRSANLAPSMALPQLQLDTASASALNTSSGSSSSSYSHRPSSLHLDTAFSAGSGSTGFYSSYSLSHSTSRLGTTPFSPIQEVAPSGQTYTSSPEQVRGMDAALLASGEDSVPPTPRDYASVTSRALSQALV